jgi:hypothetical protein
MVWHEAIDNVALFQVVRAFGQNITVSEGQEAGVPPPPHVSQLKAY